MPRTNSSTTSFSFPASSESTRALAQNEALDKQPKESFKNHTKSKLSMIGAAIAVPVGAVITCLKVPAVTSFLSQSVPLFSMGSVSLTGIGAMTLAGFSAGAPIFLGGAYQGLKSVIGPLFPNTDSEYRRAKKFVKNLSIKNGNIESTFKDNQTVFRVQGRFSPFQRASVKNLLSELSVIKIKSEATSNNDGNEFKKLIDIIDDLRKLNEDNKYLEQKRELQTLLSDEENQENQEKIHQLKNSSDIINGEKYEQKIHEIFNQVMDKKFGQIQKRRIALVAILLPIGGALLGAAIGSLFGGFGAIPGAAVGLGAGIFLATTFGIGAHTMKGLYAEALTKHITDFIDREISIKFSPPELQTPVRQTSSHPHPPGQRVLPAGRQSPAIMLNRASMLPLATSYSDFPQNPSNLSPDDARNASRSYGNQHRQLERPAEVRNSTSQQRTPRELSPEEAQRLHEIQKLLTRARRDLANTTSPNQQG